MFRCRIRSWALTGLIVICALVAMSSAASFAGDSPSPSGVASQSGRTPRDWPFWRGPTLDGIVQDSGPPTVWDDNSPLWSVEVPGRGHSSPVVCGSQVVLTTADEEEKKISMLAFDRTSGRRLWTTDLYQGELMHRHPKNSNASATPAFDGRRLIVSYIAAGALHVAAVRPDGRLEWQRKLGPFASQHGYGASPVLYESLVIVAGDNAGPGYLAALDRHSGREVWRTERASHASYSTPIVGQVAGRPQLLLSGCSMVSSYDPRTGKELWRASGPTEVTACTMAFGPELVYASGGFPGKEILAIRADGSGDVTDTHIVWRTKSGVSYVPSPIYRDGRLYIINDSGVATCFAGDTGKVLWKERLGGNFTASPLLCGDRMYAANEEGTTFVFAVAPEFKMIAENKLAAGQYATMAICEGRIYLRTMDRLLVVGASTPAQVSVTTR